MDSDNKRKLVSWIGVGVLSIGAFCACFFIKGNYSILGWVDGTFYGAVIVLLLFLLSLVTRFGAFDIFRYGFYDVFTRMRPNGGVRKYSDYQDFLYQRKESRKKHPIYFWPWLTFFVIFLIAFLVLRIFFYGKN